MEREMQSLVHIQKSVGTISDPRVAKNFGFIGCPDRYDYLSTGSPQSGPKSSIRKMPLNSVTSIIDGLTRLYTEKLKPLESGSDERSTPGNTAAVQADMPFRGLTSFGGAFLSKFECAQMPHPINEFAKRARAANIHSYIISHLQKEMPSLMGKTKTQKRLINNLEDEFANSEVKQSSVRKAEGCSLQEVLWKRAGDEQRIRVL
ncbi:hypothetical protein NC652_010104 [Populus alba x Populus x berolinensis]|nr:hypothetical protein NC652_010104 [Populus alba x Populus x berolinensis]